MGAGPRRGGAHHTAPQISPNSAPLVGRPRALRRRYRRMAKGSQRAVGAAHDTAALVWGVGTAGVEQ